MIVQQNKYLRLLAPQVRQFVKLAIFLISSMSNIFRVNSIIQRSHPVESNEHQFLKTIIRHIEYLFGSIIKPSHSTQSTYPLHELSIIKKPQTTNKQDSQGKQFQQDYQQDYQHQEQSQNDLQQVPSIEQISNFEEVEQSESKVKINKKRIKKKRFPKKRRNKLYENTKKPVSSFVFFYKDRLKQIKSSRGAKQIIHIGNLAKMLSAQWKRLGASQKQPYIEMAEKSLKQYYSDKQKINEELYSKQDQKQKDKNNINQQALDKPQEGNLQENGQPSNPPPLSSFLMYFNSQSQRISKQTGLTKRSKLAKIISEEWKHLPLIERKKYQNNHRKQQENIDILKESKVILPSNPKKIKKYGSREEQQYLPTFRAKSKRISKKNNIQKIQKVIVQDNSAINEANNQDNLVDPLNKMDEEQNSYFQQNDNEEHMQNMMGSADLINQYTIIQLNSNEEDMDHLLSQSFNHQDQSKIMHGRRRDKKIKGPISAFLLYYQENIKQLMVQNIKGQGSDLVKLASAHWSKLPQQQKQIYIQEAKISRQVYQKEVEQLRSQRKSSPRRLRKDKQEQK